MGGAFGRTGNAHRACILPALVQTAPKGHTATLSAMNDLVATDYFRPDGEAERGSLIACSVRALLLATVSASLSGCMLVASSVVCDIPVSTSTPVLSAHLVSGGSPPRDNSGVRFRSSLLIDIYSDGSLSYFNDSYPWCRTLNHAEMQSIRASLETLLHKATDTPSILHEDVTQGATFVVVRFDHGGTDGDPFLEAVSWSPSFENTPATLKALDSLFCNIEATLGSGFRHEISTHFSDFMAARARSTPCR